MLKPNHVFNSNNQLLGGPLPYTSSARMFFGKLATPQANGGSKKALGPPETISNNNDSTNKNRRKNGRRCMNNAGMEGEPETLTGTHGLKVSVCVCVWRMCVLGVRHSTVATQLCAKTYIFIKNTFVNINRMIYGYFTVCCCC